MTRFRFSVYIAATAALAVALVWSSATQAQMLINTNFEPPGSPANWHENNNWRITNGVQQDQRFVPDGSLNEGAIINGGQIAQVSTLLDANTSPRGPGFITVSSGTLEILGTGSITLIQPGVGSLVNRTTTIGDKLIVSNSGNLNTTVLNLNANSNTTISGSGIVNATTATLAANSNTTISGSGKLNATTLTFAANSNTTIQFSAPTASPFNATGLANLNGKLNLDYTGVSDLGTKTLITAGTSIGAFSSVTSTGLSAGQSVVVGSKNGLVTATRANVPTLTINRQTGAMTLQNTHLSNVPLDGLVIRSALGALDPTKFTGLPSAGWATAESNTVNSLAQIYEGPNVGSPSFAYTPGAPVQIATNNGFHTPVPTSFLQETEDVTFELTDPSLPHPIRGIVNYSGQKVINNNIVLTINAAGQAVLLNQSPFPQKIEMYRITSSGSALQTDTWNPLANQSGLDNDTWSVSGTSNTTTLLEVTEAGSSMFSSTGMYNIGQVLDPGFAQSGITFEYLIEGSAALTTGAVVFGALPTLNTGRLGDFNNDLKVDAADYTVWRNNVGAINDTSLNNNGDQVSGVTQNDYRIWKQNFGNTYSGSGSGALATGSQVPEPSTFVLLTLVFGAALLKQRSVG